MFVNCNSVPAIVARTPSRLGVDRTSENSAGEGWAMGGYLHVLLMTPQRRAKVQSARLACNVQFNLLFQTKTTGSSSSARRTCRENINSRLIWRAVSLGGFLVRQARRTS